MSVPLKGLVTQGLVAQGQIPAVVVVVTWVAGCAAVVYPSHRRGLFSPWVARADCGRERGPGVDR